MKEKYNDILKKKSEKKLAKLNSEVFDKKEAEYDLSEIKIEIRPPKFENNNHCYNYQKAIFGLFKIRCGDLDILHNGIDMTINVDANLLKR